MSGAMNLDFEIAALPSAVDNLCQQIDSWLMEIGLIRESFPVAMLLRESLNNAMLHGCCSDPGLKIRCQLSLERDWLTIQVVDPGSGFDWDYARYCPRRETDCHGRGLRILEIYADEIMFTPRGNGVVLRRRIRGDL